MSWDSSRAGRYGGYAPYQTTIYPPIEEKKAMSTRFDYVKYDEIAAHKQAQFKEKLVELDHWVETHLPNGRAKSLVFTKLEEAYMWIGKAIRDEQVAERKAELQEGRNNE